MKSIFAKLGVTQRMIIPFTICVFLVMAASVIYSTIYLSDAYMKNIRKDATTQAQLVAGEIDKLTLAVSSAVDVMGEAMKMIDLEQNSAVHQVISQTIRVNPNIYGSTFALHPGAGYGKRSPYVYQIDAKKLDASDLADSYDYEEEIWYTQPVAAKRPTWCEPYFDDGGGNVLMVTYSVPVYTNDNRQLLGVMTGDIALEWLDDFIAAKDERLYAFIIDRNTGMYIAHPNKDYILNNNIGNVAAATNNTELALIGKGMVAGQKSFGEYVNESDAKASYIAYCPTTVADWSIAIVLDKTVMMQAQNHLRNMQTGIMTFGFALFVLVIILIARSIKRQLGVEPDELIQRLEKLAKGEIEKLDSSINHRYANNSVAAYVDGLSQNLASTAIFADAIGNGDFGQEYMKLGDSDVLGNALLEMRANLQKTKKEAEILQREEQQRNWATEGLARMGELLRQHNDNLEALSSVVISEMVKYLGANQGGLFVLNDADDTHKFLELTACYAYDRKKFADKQIELGEGLTGTCFLEGETIYMTELPHNYIEITSGLGGDAPKALLITPLKVNEQIYGVIELASFEPFEQYQIAFVEKVSESIASTLSSVKTNLMTQRLLAQSKLQAEEMVNQEEELRQNMEEMQATQEEMYRKNQEMEQARIELTRIMSQNEYQLTKLNMIMDVSNIGLWDMEIVNGDPVNPDNTFHWSDKFRHMLGYSDVADFPNVLSSWSDKLHPDDKERTLDAFAQHLLDRTGNTPYDLEYRLLKKNGEYSYYHAFGATIRDEEGYALRVTGAIQDITKDKDIVNEMRRRETELQEVLIKSQKSEKGFREKVHWYEALLDAFEESPISVTDMNKNLTFLNKAALTILGTTREATMGKYCGDVWNVDICKDERCGIECLKCGKGKSEFQVGDVTFTTLASYIKDSEGNNIGHIEVVDNITQIANKDFEMQQFYNAIFETDNVVEFASDAIITAVNQNFLNLWQADRSSFIGKHLSAFVGEDAFNEIKTTVRKGKIFDEEMNMTVGGKQMRCNLTFVPINDKQGNMLRVLLLADVEE